MPEFKYPRAETRTFRISIVLMAAIMIALSCLLYWQAKKLKGHQSWVEHSYQVKMQIQELERSLWKAEGMQLDVRLVGESDSGQLNELFTQAASEAVESVQRLKFSVRDNPSQTLLVDLAIPMVGKRLESMKRNSLHFQNLDESARVNRTLDGLEEAAFLEMHLAKIQASEEALLSERSGKVVKAESHLLAMATIGSLLGLGVMGLALVREKQSDQLRRLYQGRLSEARDNALNAVQATSIFVASVSHEIRTPMNGVLGAADLLTQDRRLDRRQRELVETIRYCGEGLLDLINDILDLSKLQAGKMELVAEDFSLAETIDECLALFADAAGRKNLELAHRIEPALSKSFHGDCRRLRQVLINLVGNAVKFTDVGSVLVEVTQRGGEAGRPVLRFRVTDTGPGIGKTEQDQLFIPFSQVNSKPRRRHTGTGLGLAISREIVQRLGGSMGVESDAGAGSTFWFTVQMKDAEVENVETHDRLCNGGTLLLIEGRKLTAGAIAEHVRAWGMQVVTISELCRLELLAPISNLSAIVIGDHLGASWKEVIRHLGARGGMENVPRFLLSQPHRQPLPEEVKASGIMACLRFPFRPSDLYDLLTCDRVEPDFSAEEDDPMPSAKVLLVEDNAINQRIFGRQLDLLGLKYEICGDGAEGVEARITGNFDLVMMDCQMAAVDGFQATRRIRAWEQKTGESRIPIIAVTAHVMNGDSEACFQAGMDDYLPKPFDLAKLKGKLVRWLEPLARPHKEKDSSSVTAHHQTLNLRVFCQCMTGNPSVDEELVTMALDETELRLNQLKAAHESRDDDAWRDAAHQGMGGCGMIGLEELAAQFSDAEHDDGDDGRRAASLLRIQAVVLRARVALIVAQDSMKKEPEPVDVGV